MEIPDLKFQMQDARLGRTPAGIAGSDPPSGFCHPPSAIQNPPSSITPITLGSGSGPKEGTGRPSPSAGLGTIITEPVSIRQPVPGFRRFAMARLVIDDEDAP